MPADAAVASNSRAGRLLNHSELGTVGPVGPKHLLALVVERAPELGEIAKRLRELQATGLAVDPDKRRAFEPFEVGRLERILDGLLRLHEAPGVMDVRAEEPVHPAEKFRPTMRSQRSARREEQVGVDVKAERLVDGELGAAVDHLDAKAPPSLMSEPAGAPMQFLDPTT